MLFELSIGLLVMSLLASLAIIVPLSRRIPSAVLAGTLGAAASGGLIVVLLIGSIAVIVAR